MTAALSVVVIVTVLASCIGVAYLCLAPSASPAAAAGSTPSLQTWTGPTTQSTPLAQQSHPSILSHPGITKIAAVIQQHPAVRVAVAQAIANHGAHGRK